MKPIAQPLSESAIRQMLESNQRVINDFAASILNLVQPVGIEPTSSVLQTGAMTTSAKVAYNWYQRRGSNSLKNANLALKGV